MHDSLTSYLDVLPSFVDAEVLRCAGTAEHSSRVGTICAAMSRTLRLEPKDVEVMNWIGILHDLGKLAVPVQILRKPGPLSRLEWVEVKQHPIVGSDLVLAISPGLAPLAEAVRAHHERWDGSGYPDKLDKFDIPLFGRIVAIADVFDAITHPRDYRAGHLTTDEGIEFVQHVSNRRFDPELVRVFNDSLKTVSRFGKDTPAAVT
jgi:HD-GYP domain-containing protein (c-di-GMP phosphodiesterase class II)